MQCIAIKTTKLSKNWKEDEKDSLAIQKVTIVSQIMDIEIYLQFRQLLPLLLFMFPAINLYLNSVIENKALDWRSVGRP